MTGTDEDEVEGDETEILKEGDEGDDEVEGDETAVLPFGDRPEGEILNLSDD